MPFDWLVHAILFRWPTRKWQRLRVLSHAAHFDEMGISEHHEVLYEMGMKEKEHEMYFLEKLRSHPMLPIFEKHFFWGSNSAMNDVELEAKYSLEASKGYCRDPKDEQANGSSESSRSMTASSDGMGSTPPRSSSGRFRASAA